jgi:hypothetical protein
MRPESMIMKTPADSAPAASRLRNAVAARWVETRDDEHAVFVDTQGPVRPNVYEMRPIRNSNPLPVDTFGVMGTPRPAE